MTNIAVDEMLNSEEIDAIKTSVNRFIQQQVQHNWPTWVEQKRFLDPALRRWVTPVTLAPICQKLMVEAMLALPILLRL